MLKYLIKRIIIAIPTLFLISVIVFLMGQSVTDDPMAAHGGQSFSGATNDPDAESAYLTQQAHHLHIDKPNFYCAIGLTCLPDTLYKIQPVWRKNKMKKLALQCGDWIRVKEYEAQLAASIRWIEALPDSLLQRTEVNKTISLLKTATNPVDCDRLIAELPPGDAINRLKNCLTGIYPTSGWGIPALHWYGLNNQYHDWLTAKYASENHSPWKKIYYPLRVTLFIKIMALLLAFGLAIPVGLILGNQPKWDKFSKYLLVLLYVSPVILIGCVLRYLFATPGQGWFSPFIGGVGTSVYNNQVSSFGTWIMANKGRLLLPIITVSVHTLVFIALQMRSGVISVAQQDFIRTAQAKGLPNRNILWRHIFPNALFPIVVLFGNLLPSVLSGAVLVELIFNINGLGYTTYDAILNQDFQVLMTIVLLTATVTIIGSLIADLLLSWLDPRVRIM